MIHFLTIVESSPVVVILEGVPGEAIRRLIHLIPYF
jgi:hypothetical protein